VNAKIAYFSMEFGLHEDLHTYAGGLGILAGDHMKGAADLGMPLVGIGILWRQGYTTQLIGDQGWPYDSYPHFRYDWLEDPGVTVKVQIRDRTVAVKAWCVRCYGNAPLYLLDTGLPENDYSDQFITAQLYGGTGEDRLAQEIVLGIGGVRVLRALGYRPQVFHFNEGHAVLAGMELMRELMEHGSSFQEAWKFVKQLIVFTTHTPVPEGNESHSLDQMEYMGAFNGLTRQQMSSIGGDPFGMTVAGLRISRISNGVAELHGHTSRAMWEHVEGASPIIHITNGVHPGTWQSNEIRNATSHEELWTAHMNNKQTLLNEIYARTGSWLDPQVLTIGFARRAAPYKRSALIFRDPSRIEPLLREGKLNLIFSGKAHPRDDNAKGTVAHLVEMSQRYKHHVIFLQNYDMRVGRMLTQGCDIWLNNPIKPLEASGTSGMKAAMNGVLNMSVPDGWWPEALQHGVNGWGFGGDYPSWDKDHLDAEGLYQTLLGEVVPTYYDDRNRWLQMMEASIKSTQESFSIHRMLNQYRELMYKI